MNDPTKLDVNIPAKGDSWAWAETCMQRSIGLTGCFDFSNKRNLSASTTVRSQSMTVVDMSIMWVQYSMANDCNQTFLPFTGTCILCKYIQWYFISFFKTIIRDGSYFKFFGFKSSPKTPIQLRIWSFYERPRSTLHKGRDTSVTKSEKEPSKNKSFFWCWCVHHWCRLNLDHL